jgi:bifunctional DNase/RNase
LETEFTQPERLISHDLTQSIIEEMGDEVGELPYAKDQKSIFD